MASPASWPKTSTTWWTPPSESTRSTGCAAPRWRASDSVRDTWQSATSRSTGGDRWRSKPSPPPMVARWPSSACRELRGRLRHPVDDGLPFADRVVQPARLRVVVDHDRPVVDPDQPRAIEGVAADHAFAGLLRPHLIEDEVAMRVGDQVVLVDLHGLDPVRVIADHQVGTVVDRQVADLPRVVGSDPGSGDRL